MYSRYILPVMYSSFSFITLLHQGVMQADPGVIREYNHIFRLYCHESQRVFHDRLVDKHDKIYFNTMLSEMAVKHFSKVCAIVNSLILYTFCTHRTLVPRNLKSLLLYLVILSRLEQLVQTECMKIL